MLLSILFLPHLFLTFKIRRPKNENNKNKTNFKMAMFLYEHSNWQWLHCHTSQKWSVIQNVGKNTVSSIKLSHFECERKRKKNTLIKWLATCFIKCTQEISGYPLYLNRKLIVFLWSFFYLSFSQCRDIGVSTKVKSDFTIIVNELLVSLLTFSFLYWIDSMPHADIRILFK